MQLELGPIIRAASRRRAALALVVLEFASGFTVITCLFLAGTWYRRMGDVHSGLFEADLIEVLLQRPPPAEEEPHPGRAWHETVASVITGTPDVVAAAPVNASLLDDRMAQPSRLRVVGRAADASGWTVRAGLDLPAVLGLRLVEGAYPQPGQPDSVMISAYLRHQLFPEGGRAVGRRLTSGEITGGTVVGVFEDLALRRPFVRHTQSQAILFSPVSDERRARFLVRTQAGRRLAVADALQARVSALVGPAGLAQVKLYTAENSRQYVITRGILVMLVLLGINVAFVALLGPVAVSSFLVAERIRQIGVRRALGASQFAVVRYFLVENALLMFMGIALGALAVAPFYIFMRPFFYGAELRPWMIILTAGLLLFDGTLAALLPALRAARTAPSVAARSF